MQSRVEIRPSNASQGQHRRKDATEQMKNLKLARTRTVDSKRHIIIRTATLCNEINSGLIMKNTIYIYK